MKNSLVNEIYGRLHKVKTKHNNPEDAPTRKQIRAVVDAMLASLAMHLVKRRKVNVTNFGTFRMRLIKNGSVWNPKEKKIVVKELERARVSFKASPAFKALLKEIRESEREVEVAYGQIRGGSTDVGGEGEDSSEE